MKRCDCHTDDGPSRKLVVAFDGTENQYGAESSHVVEFYARVVKNKNQLSYYNSGIGTYVKPSLTSRVRTVVKNKWASLTAWNFKSNLLAGYRWLAENYQDGDQIYLLGFSRGAYQARVLAAMIREVGLICTGNDEQIPFAYDIYKLGTVSIDPNLSDPNAPTTLTGKFKEAFCRQVNIHFVGVWDTVSSVGIFRGKNYPGAELADNICFFRHALALDERRVKFLPEYVVAPDTWFQQSEALEQPRCKEVWFRGSHSDIGGGNQKNPGLDIGGLPSRWIAYEAMLAGLQLKPVLKPWHMDDFVRLKKPSNSMSPFYLFLEYIPFITWLDTSSQPSKVRSIPHRRRPRNIQPHQKIHISAGIHSYADEDERTIANLPQLEGDTLSWRQLCDLATKQQVSSKSPVDEPQPRSDKSPSKPSQATQEVRPTLRHASRSFLVNGPLPSVEELQPWSLDSNVSQGRTNLKDASRPSYLPRRLSTMSSVEEGPLSESQVLPQVRSILQSISRIFHRRPTMFLLEEMPLPSQVSQQVRTTSRNASQLLSWLLCQNTTDRSPQEPRKPIGLQSNEWLQAHLSMFELDWLDYGISPTLIDGVSNGLNVVEFLERLNLFAHCPKGRRQLRESAACWNMMLDLLKEATNDIQKAELGIRLAEKLIDSKCHAGANYLQLLDAVQAIECSPNFRYHERASALHDRLTKHNCVITAQLGQAQEERVGAQVLAAEVRTEVVMQRSASEKGKNSVRDAGVEAEAETCALVCRGFEF